MSIWTPVGYQQIAGAVAATGLTVPAGAQRAIINVITQPVRWRDDGTDPTAALGILVPAATEFEYIGDLEAIKLIQTAATTEINICYYS